MMGRRQSDICISDNEFRILPVRGSPHLLIIMTNCFRYTTAIVRGMAASLPAQAQRITPPLQQVCSKKAEKQLQNYIEILR